MSNWTAADIPSQEGRTAIVTGANSGIGYHAALALGRSGARTILACRDAGRGEAALARMRAEAPDADFELRLLDMASLDSIRAFAYAAPDRVDLLLNNAGFGLKGPFADLDLERQAEMVRLNCKTPLELMHLALGPMRARREGGIINVASIAGYQPIPLLATYSASKAFLLTLSEAVAEEVREYFIPDFTDWKDHDTFEGVFKKLLHALKAEALNDGDRAPGG